jgi:hypothetical protein
VDSDQNVLGCCPCLRTIVQLAHANKSVGLTIRERLRRMAELSDNWPTKTTGFTLVFIDQGNR